MFKSNKLLILFIGIFLISSISAANWDNIKNYNENEEKITLYNWNVVGKLFDVKLAEYTLTDNTYQCLTDCYAEGTATLYTNEQLFSNLTFKDEEGFNTNIKSSKIFIEIKNKWEEYKGQILLTGTYKWRIEGTKGLNERVDWIGTTFGKDLTEWAWWDSDWDKKQLILIQDRNGTSYTDYQVELNITYDSDMETDFSDLRFVNSSENAEIDYCLLEYGSSNYARVYVKVPRMTANQNSTIYMYYNNSGASAKDKTTTCNNTMLEYVDNSTASGWTCGAGASAINMNGLLHIETSGADRCVTNYSFDEKQMVFENKFQVHDVAGATTESSAIGHPLYSVNQFRLDTSEAGNTIGWFHGGAGAGLTTWTADTFLKFKVYSQLGISADYYLFNNVDSQLGNINKTGDATGSPNRLNGTDIGLKAGGTQANLSFEYIFFRKYLNISYEPTISFGEEQKNYLYFDLNSSTFNSSVYETSAESFIINMTYNSSAWSDIEALLYYDGNSYTSTESGSGNNLVFSRAIDIPTISGASSSKTFIWNLKFTNSTGDYYENITTPQTVNQIVFVLCNTTYPDRYINFSFRDEADSSIINASIPTSTFLYHLGSGTTNKTLSFINNTENFNYEFCFSLNNSLYIDSYIQYKKTDYPQRIYNPDSTLFTNTTTNTTLYLLESDDGIYVTFQIINSLEQLQSEVEVNANRTISGLTTVVGTGTTGDSGTVTFWLNPDFIHDFTFEKTGFTTYETSFAPTQSSYTITLSGGGVTPASDYTRGITTDISPKLDELFNDTSHTFAFNVTSSYWDLDSFGFSLRLANGSIVGSDSSAVSGVTSSVIYNVNNQSIIYMDYYWIIEGNTSIGTRYWVVTNTQYTHWSIKTFFTDLTLYLNSGLFGLDNFGRYLIVFIILFFSVGIMSYKYGLTSPMSVTSMIFAIIFFFDIVVGLLPEIRGIEHILTYLAGLVLVGTIIMEVSK